MIRSGAPRASASRAPQRAAASPTSLPSTPTTTSRAGGSLAVGRAAGAVAGGRSDVVGVGVDTAHLRGNGPVAASDHPDVVVAPPRRVLAVAAGGKTCSARD